MTLRNLALKLFAKVYGLKNASTYLVKKQFPKFRASIREHWEFLVLKLLGIYKEKQQQQQTKVEPKQDLSKLTDFQLQSLAIKNGINPQQPRFKLLNALGYNPEPPKNNISPTIRRGKSIPQWNGKL
jgi:hypothetical protein